MYLDFVNIGFLLYFLPLFFIFYAITPGKWKNVTLFLGSAIFYILGEPVSLLVLPVSILLNYLFGLLLDKGGKKGILCLAIAGNLMVLAGFKLHGGAIPLGLSFYTFQAISYLADIYRGEIDSERNLGKFALYMGMFPKIGSGPIVAYGDIKDALTKRGMTAEGFQKGMQLFILGLSAKVLLADRLQILWHDLEVAGYESVTWRYAWIGAIAFSLKLYFDFHGYSLMAIGLGRMMGFSLPDNFKTPYLSRSVREFYRRWHITLGVWFRKYVYIPLGGNRKGEGRTILNLLAVWILTGLWHGFSVNFFLWGLFLWCLIVLERWVERLNFVKKLKVLPHLYLWFVIPISWMFFAIPDKELLQIYLNRMFGLGEVYNGNILDYWIAIQRHGGILAVSILCASGIVEKIQRKNEKAPWLNAILACLFWLCVWKIFRQGSNPFQYVNF